MTDTPDPHTTAQPAGTASDAPTAPATAAAQREPATAEPAAAAQRTDGVVVKRTWLYAGGGVAALAALGLAFGCGYLVGDATGHDHGARPGHGRMMDRWEDDAPRGERPFPRGPGARTAPPVPDEAPDDQAPTTTPEPAPTTPATPG